MGLVINKMAVAENFLRLLLFSHAAVFPPMLYKPHFIHLRPALSNVNNRWIR